MNPDCVNCGRPKAEHAGPTNIGHCPGSVGMGRGAPRYCVSLKNKRPGRSRTSRRSPLDGGGPWMILENCPAERHNSYRAADGRWGVKCICPHARAQRSGQMDRSNQRRRQVRKDLPVIREQAVTGSIQALNMLRSPRDTGIPPADFRGGACTKPYNRRAVEAGFNITVSAEGIRERRRAKQVCQDCPLREKVCAPFIRAAESPRGSWPGVWAGMDPWERMGQRMALLDGKVHLVEI